MHISTNVKMAFEIQQSSIDHTTVYASLKRLIGRTYKRQKKCKVWQLGEYELGSEVEVACATQSIIHEYMYNSHNVMIADPGEEESCEARLSSGAHVCVHAKARFSKALW